MGLSGILRSRRVRIYIRFLTGREQGSFFFVFWYHASRKNKMQ